MFFGGSIQRSLGLRAAGLLIHRTHRLAHQLDLVTVRENPLHDGIGERGAADEVVPGLDGILAGQDRRTHLAPVFENLEEVATFHVRHGRQTPIINGNHIGLCQLRQQPVEAAVSVCQAELTKELRCRDIAGTKPAPAGFFEQSRFLLYFFILVGPICFITAGPFYVDMAGAAILRFSALSLSDPSR
jgi:hypothetical protein